MRSRFRPSRRAPKIASFGKDFRLRETLRVIITCSCGSFFDLAMKLQLESTLQQRLQHQPQLVKVRIWIFCLPFDIETVRGNPSWASGYLEFLDSICGADQHL